LSGSTRCPGSLSTHFEEETECEPPAAWHRLRLIKQFAPQRRAHKAIVSQYNSLTTQPTKVTNLPG
jgi:hypothetical protein